MTGPQPVQLDGQQVEALNALLALVHYDDLASVWLNLLPRELRDATPYPIINREDK